MFSRRYILHLLEKELLRAQRYESPFTLLAIELDLLSQNSHIPYLSTEDTNLLVGEAARAIRKHIRDSDSPGRAGERTFLCLLPETDVKGTVILAERILKSLDKDVETSIGPVRMASYAGIIESNDPTIEDMAGLLYVEDQKLTAARDKGLNCVIK